MTDKVAVVVGVGPGNGTALARRFAVGGYSLALLARDGAAMEAMAADFDDARGYRCDVTDPSSVAEVFSRIADELGPADALLFKRDRGCSRTSRRSRPAISRARGA